MINYRKEAQFTAHTTTPRTFNFSGLMIEKYPKDGVLGDIAPTILKNY